MPSGYDRIAGFYDSLAGLVFGKSITRAQQYGLSEIEAGSNILIIGGGTGYVLEYLSQCKIDDLRIDYVETSEVMIDRAKQRKLGCLTVNYIYQQMQELTERKTYDVIITQFFLDSFQGQDLEHIFSLIHERLRVAGIWIIADFKIARDCKKFWQKFLLSIMYLFFTIAVGLKTRRLEDFRALFARLGYRLLSSQSYYRGFIFSSAYQKSE